MDDIDFFGQMINQSVKLGKIYVPARSLHTVLGGYCKNLLVWTHDETYKFQLLGTAIPVFYRERYLLICTAHQLQNVNLEDVCMLYPDGSSSVSNSGVRQWNNGAAGETDATDITVFEFTEPLEAHRELRAGFFKFDAVPQDIRSDHVIALVTAGFPSSDQIYDLGENNHLGSVKRNIIAMLDGQPDDRALVRARFVEPLNFDPDGMSGSPVFVVQFQNGKLYAYLAGMMMRAGEETFHFLKVGYVKGFLDKFVA